ncbi:MAG: hypothetical protein ACLFUB_11035, partial [Cyclobacteriaceae bacterium]
MNRNLSKKSSDFDLGCPISEVRKKDVQWINRDGKKYLFVAKNNEPTQIFSYENQLLGNYCDF